MRLTYYASKTRGLTATGWLVGKHMFSFGEYINVQRMRFGSLRVFNDDLILGGTGFGAHSHDNMEIITVILQGAVKHQDSMGNLAVVSLGEVQTMSAGTGVTHSEVNASETESLKLLQIWIDTATQDIAPAYDQKSFDFSREGEWITVAGPKDEAGAHATIHQQAWVYHGQYEAGKQAKYQVKVPNKNGLFLFVIDGEAQVGEQELQKGDGLGIQEVENLTITIKQNAKLLLIEMPI